MGVMAFQVNGVLFAILLGNMSKNFSISTYLKQIEACTLELNKLVMNDSVPDSNKYNFDKLLISIIETSLQLKVHHDLPEEPIDFDLHEYLVITGKNFAYSQGQIKLVLED
jgi:hypothetical protein